MRRRKPAPCPHSIKVAEAGLPQQADGGAGASEVIEFPAGLPAFENERRFELQAPPEFAPLVFLQSLASPALSFVTLPVECVDPHYRPAVLPEDWALLGWDAAGPGRAGADLLCLVILTLSESRAPTANLMAPVFIRRSTRLAVQAVRDDDTYSCQHPVGDPRGPECT